LLTSECLHLSDFRVVALTQSSLFGRCAEGNAIVPPAWKIVGLDAG
jgi:hypothetical protein